MKGKKKMYNSINILDDNEKIRDRILSFTGRVDDENTHKLYYDLLEISAEDEIHQEKSRIPIKLFIDSDGGYDDSAFKIIDLISRMKTPVDTYCAGKCASAAALMFMAGRKRYITEHAFILLHDLSSHTDQMSVTKMVTLVYDIETRQTMLIDYIYSHSNYKKRDVINFIKSQNDKVVYAKEAIEYGLATDMFPKF